MANVAVLSRLTAGSLWREPDYIGGGIPAITGEDIRGALGGLSLLEMRLALVIWCREESEFQALERAAFIGAATLPRVQGWRRKNEPGLLRAFVAAALAEVIHPPVCRACNGAGSIRYTTDAHGKRLNALEIKRHQKEKRETREHTIGCQTCEGTGRKRLSDSELAQVASIYQPMSRQTWARLSREFGYEDIHDWLKRRADTVERHIRVQLRD